jgi:hypothetical protein
VFAANRRASGYPRKRRGTKRTTAQYATIRMQGGASLPAKDTYRQRSTEFTGKL